MKTHKNDPISYMTSDQDILNKFKGLTKREYFAALALQGLLQSITLNSYNVESFAASAVTQADVLIAELNKEYK